MCRNSSAPHKATITSLLLQADYSPQTWWDGEADREVLPPLDDDVAIEGVHLHQERPPAHLLTGDKR